MEFTTFTPKVLPEGKYQAVIQSVEPTSGDYGPQLKVMFKVTFTDTMEQIEIMEWVSPQKSTKYPLFADLLDLVGVKGESGEFDEQSLVGKDCVAECVLKPSKKDGMNYLRVTRVSAK